MKQEMKSKSKDSRKTNHSKGSGNKFPKREHKFNDYDKSNERQYKMDANDPSWYAQSPQLLKDAASLAFSNMLGNPLSTKILHRNYTAPGIMSIWYDHALGGGRTSVDAPTVAARYIYSFVRHANSGSANYEAPDLFMYIVAWAQVKAFLEMGKRAYGTLLNYTVRNRYYVDTLIQAMGFDPQSLRQNMPGFRQVINQGIARLNSLKIPSGMPLVSRWSWLPAHIWVDNTGSKAQTYIFRPARFYKYSGYTSETGTSLVSVDVANTQFTVETFSATLNELLDPLVSEEDCGIMSGDIIKAYGSDLETLGLIDESFVCLPEYSEEVLSQIHNAVSIPGAFNWTGGEYYNNVFHEITQDADGVVQDTIHIPIKEESTARAFTEEAILNMYHDDVTPEEVMVATRLTTITAEPLGTPVWPGVNEYGLRNTGSELCLGFDIWLRPTDITSTPTELHGDGYVITISSSLKSSLTEIVEIQLDAFQTAVSAITMFRRHPRFYTGVEYDPDGTDVRYYGILGDFENFTLITREKLANMNRVAILSECATTSKTRIG